MKIGHLGLAADVIIPPQCAGVVIFAHGSGSSRHSPRNRAVAKALNQSALATVLFDLLTPDEAEGRENVFDISLLTERMNEAIVAIRDMDDLRGVRIGLFGASTGAAAALRAAALQGKTISAVVSRGGRPDLAMDVLHQVHAPTLLIVGERDEQVIALNRKALAQLRCDKRLEIVPGASHLFEEEGTMGRVVELASNWFTRHLGRLGDE